MIVLSLFDGMSCGQVALERAGLLHDGYYAAEIDEHAVSVTQRNYPWTVQLGDVTTWREWDVDWSDVGLVMGGSPCQGFSSAGAQLAFDDPRSVLFFEFVDVLGFVQLHNPDVKFLLENVKMASAHERVISSFLGVDPVLINSAVVSAQMRARNYWANWSFPAPSDVGAVLDDVLDGEYWSTRDKAYCIDANYAKGTNFKRYFFRGSRQLVLETGYDPREGMRECDANEIMHRDGNRWRKLTPVECERLQTVPEGYTSGVPDRERYKMLGNGWTVDVVAHVLRYMEG